MPLGRPSISDPRVFDLRAFQNSVSNIRQRIEALEAAVSVLQNAGGGTGSTAFLQAQITALQQIVNNLPTPSTVGTSLVYVEVAGDRVLEASDFTDSLRCLVTTGNTGSQNLVVSDDGALDVAVGAAVLVFVEGGAGVQITAVSGVALLIRDGLSGELAGQYAAATLVKRAANEWFLTGDLAAAA